MYSISSHITGSNVLFLVCSPPCSCPIYYLISGSTDVLADHRRIYTLSGGATKGGAVLIGFLGIAIMVRIVRCWHMISSLNRFKPHQDIDHAIFSLFGIQCQGVCWFLNINTDKIYWSKMKQFYLISRNFELVPSLNKISEVGLGSRVSKNLPVNH